MSAIVPPLDKLATIPAIGVNKFVAVINKQTDKLIDQVTKVAADAEKLAVSAKCDDPKIKQIKSQIEQIQKQIQVVQQIVPKVTTTINTVKTLITAAQSIKLALTVAQLSNPITAPVFIAGQLTLIQDAIIVNAIKSLNILADVPASIPPKLAGIIPPLIAAASAVSTACGQDELPLSIPNISTFGGGGDGDDNDGDDNDGDDNDGDDFNISTGDGIDGIDNTLGWNDALSSEFYNLKNVSNSDLEFRSDTIEEVLQQQRDLLESIQEAPSKVYKSNEIKIDMNSAQIGDQGQILPDTSIGKLGDYYMDTKDQLIYGPKLSADSWGDPVNY